MMHKILVVGGSGLLGSYVIKFFTKKYVVGTYYNNKLVSKRLIRLDINSKDEINDVFLNFQPHIVIHLASLGNIDICEKNKYLANKINVEGTKNILAACQKFDSKIIYPSTNAIYDGTNPPYHEQSTPNPINVYGKTKLEGEKLVKSSGVPFIIFRLMTMYGWNPIDARDNPATWIIKCLIKKQKLKIVDDVFNNHLYARSAVNIIIKAINLNKWYECYNIAGKDTLSRYEFAIIIANIFKFDSKLISPVSSNYFKSKISARAKDTHFLTLKAEKELMYKPLLCEEGLTKMKKERVVENIYFAKK
jgi:dTDP-4-dehydrorhamnose reductase